MATTRDKLQALISAGHAQRATVQWGRGYREVIILGVKSTNTKKVMLFPEYLKIKFTPCV